MPSTHSIGAEALPDESEDSDYLRDNLLDETEPATVVDTNPFRQPIVPARQDSMRREARQDSMRREARQDSMRREPRQASMRHETVGSARHDTINSARRETVSSARLVIAIDYGTTFTGLALATTNSDDIELKNIEVLQKWSTKIGNHQKVPSLISYAKAFNGEEQWASSISNNAVTMVNTKLELEPQGSLFDELDLTLHTLMGTGNLGFEHLRKAGPEPAYTARSPTEIVTDYLHKVYECACRTIDVGQLNRTKTPVDLVITVPVNWSHQATDSTFQAIRGAGFNKTNFPTLKDTILVSEPGAASYFTVRDLQATGIEFLDKNDCFILADAGGGTVDVVSYQVKRVEPYLELEKATAPKSAKCGSAFIDTAFKRWLRKELEPELYGKLDPANARGRFSPHTVESGPMRDLIKRFELKKKAFSNKSEDIKLNLPAPLDRLTIDGRVKDGELFIYRDEMKELIDSCVDGVIELIEDQIDKVRSDKSRRVKNVLLVGGFGASPYLREELKESLDMRELRLRQPDLDKSWTAVVQGAVIYGVEKSRHPEANYMAAVTKSYGVVVEDRFEWLVKKGDLVLSREKRSIHSRIFSIPPTKCPMGKLDIPIYSYVDKDDYAAPAFWQEGQHEVERVGLIKCDVSKFSDQNLRVGRMHGRTNQRNHNIGPLKCRIQLSNTSIEAEILLNKSRVGRCEIRVDVDPPARAPRYSWHEGDDY